jgi:hypothetical protein
MIHYYLTHIGKKAQANTYLLTVKIKLIENNTIIFLSNRNVL